MKVFITSFLLAYAGAAPNPNAEAGATPNADADADSDPNYGYALGHNAVAPAVVHVGPAPSCKTENEILTTQNCVPRTENVCNTITVDTEEIEYVPLCKETNDFLCDHAVGYAGHIIKREAEATADADASYYYGYNVPGGFAQVTSEIGHNNILPGGHIATNHIAGYAEHVGPNHIASYAHAEHIVPNQVIAHATVAAPVAHIVPAPIVAHAVGHSIESTIEHNCRSVKKEHCVDNPVVKVVPTEVELCHVITKVDCANVENLIPVTTCEAVTTTHISEATVPVAPIVHSAPVAHTVPLLEPAAHLIGHGAAPIGHAAPLHGHATAPIRISQPTYAVPVGQY